MKGECRVCGCTAEKPCQLYTGEECGWLSKAMNLCSNGKCIEADAKRRKEERLRKRRPNPWKVIERNAAGRAIRIVKRRDLKKKGRAA